MRLDIKLCDLVKIKETRVLGWARSKLYNNSFPHKAKLLVYSILYTESPEKPLADCESKGSRNSTPVFIHSVSHLKNHHTKEMISNFRKAIYELDHIIIETSARLSPKSIPLKIKSAIQIYKDQACNIETSRLNKILISFCAARGAIESAQIKDLLHKQSPSCVITFCDAIGHENLVAQAGKNAGIHTITLQHGQYRILNEKSFSADAEAYLNFVSDKMLCWGRATIAEFAKAGINSNRFISCGRLIPATQYQPCSTAPENIFGLILCGENQPQSNASLLEFAEQLSQETGMLYVVKLHPANPIARYEKLKGKGCIQIGKIDTPEYFSACSFSVMAMSGFFLDCIEARHRFGFLDDGGLSDVFKASGLAVTRTDEIIPLVNSISSSTFDSLAEDYNDNKFQKERIIEAIYGTPCNSI